MKVGLFRPLYGNVGHNISVYLDTSRSGENAAEEVALRWRAARQRLLAAGADASTLAAIEDVVTDPARAAAGRALFARDGFVTFTAPLGTTPRREIARVSPLPHLMPLLAQRPPSAPHLRVVANRAGGEILAVAGSGETWQQRASRRRWPVHKTSSGGWSQAQHHRRTEETWEENAKELAADVIEAANRTHAEHIVMAGDTRARSALLDHLTTRLQSRAVVVDEEVAVDSPSMGRAVDHSVAAMAERECRAKFGDWQIQRAHSGAVEGLADTLAALRDSRVANLFIADRPSSAVMVWIGPDGADLAASQGELRERGITDQMRERADAAIVRALAATGAELHFLPDDLVITGDGPGPDRIAFPRDGVCATLRWDEGG